MFKRTQDARYFFGRLGLTFLLMILFAAGATSQSMTALFRLIPLSCTPELTSTGKDSLIKQGEYIVPGGDSEETAEYSMDTSDAKNYLRCEFGFTTGQRGFIVTELKKFRKANGELFLIYSEYGGVPSDYEQRALKMFTIRNNHLIETKELLVPADIGLKSFLKPGYSDSLFTEIKSRISSSYLLHFEKENEIRFRIFSPLQLEDYKNYMIGNTILFTWNGRAFARRITWEP